MKFKKYSKDLHLKINVALPKLKKKANKDIVTACAFVGVPTVAGVVQGGSIGIAILGGAFGAPLWAAGAGAGIAGYGVYKIGKTVLKKGRQRTPRKRV